MGGSAAVTERERARLARELHDGLGGTLAVLVAQAELLVRRVGSGPGAEEAAVLEALAREALDDLRRSMHLMRRSFDLQAAIRARLESMKTRRVVACGGLRVEGRAPRLPSELLLSVYRVVQELLTNVERHAGARRVEVELRYGFDQVRVEVRDDGRGFDPREVGPSSAGLGNVRARAARFGGWLDLQSWPSRAGGTRVSVTFEVPGEGSHVHAAAVGSE